MMTWPQPVSLIVAHRVIWMEGGIENGGHDLPWLITLPLNPREPSCAQVRAEAGGVAAHGVAGGVACDPPGAVRPQLSGGAHPRRDHGCVAGPHLWHRDAAERSLRLAGVHPPPPPSPAPGKSLLIPATCWHIGRPPHDVPCARTSWGRAK